MPPPSAVTCRPQQQRHGGNVWVRGRKTGYHSSHHCQCSQASEDAVSCTKADQSEEKLLVRCRQPVLEVTPGICLQYFVPCSPPCSELHSMPVHNPLQAGRTRKGCSCRQCPTRCWLPPQHNPTTPQQAACRPHTNGRRQHSAASWTMDTCAYLCPHNSTHDQTRLHCTAHLRNSRSLWSGLNASAVPHL